MKGLLAVCLLSWSVMAVAQPDLQTLIQSMKFYRADFVQYLENEIGGESQEQTGKIFYKAPEFLRWDYLAPFPQTILLKGDELWLYDPDLMQVTIQSVSANGEATPLHLFRKPEDIESLFDIEYVDVPDTESMHCYHLIARETGTQFESIRVCFEGDQLHSMIALDNFGQRSRFEFTNIDNSSSFQDQVFELELPDDIDVIRNNE